MAIDTIYVVTCDRCPKVYEDTHPNEDILSLYIRMHDAGWRQKVVDDMPVIMCPSCIGQAAAGEKE
jgi:hypothetical protein